MLKIKFKLKWARFPVRVEVRKVRKKLPDGNFEVRYNGYDDFVVKNHEVLEVIANGQERENHQADEAQHYE